MARRLGRLGAKMMKTLRKTGAIEGSVVSLLGALAALAMVAASQEQRAPPDLEAKKIRQITGGLVGYHDFSRSCA